MSFFFCSCNPQRNLSNHLTLKHPQLSKHERARALKCAKVVRKSSPKKAFKVRKGIREFSASYFRERSTRNWLLPRKIPQFPTTCVQGFYTWLKTVEGKKRTDNVAKARVQPDGLVSKCNWALTYVKLEWR